MSNFDSVPGELKDRDQWLYWNASKDKPRKPLPTPAADKGVDWTDPDQWVSFDEAAERAESEPKAGIGYVNAADNPDYARGIYGVIDLDGVADGDGHPKDWVPSLKPFFDHDAYAEWSPSGDGIHIPIVGIEVPDWWTDQHFTDDEHEGVEVLSHKFATYTGDKMRGAGDNVAEYGEWVDEWLREAYKAVTGEDPVEERTEEIAAQATDGSSSSAPDEEWFTEDVAEEALDHIDPGCGYTVWRDVGMALANRFGGSGEALFEKWSRRSSKWDSDAEKQAERIVRDASNYQYDAGTIIHYAQQGGWDASSAAREKLGGGVPDKPNVKRVDSEEVDTTEEDSGGINSFTSLAQHGGEYGYFETNNDGETWFERVTNFELDVESFLFKDGERLIDMTVIPASGEQTYDLTVPAKVFNDARRFRDNVVTGLTTTFEGSPTDLNELRKLVGGQDAPVRNGTHHMGLHPDKGEFVTPDGVLTADGWNDDPEMAYIEREIAAERAFKLSPESYDDYNRDEVAEILELLPKTRNSDRFLPVLGWLYTAPLRPYIQQWEGQFNTLHVTGETGAGKSSTLSVAWQLLGMNGDPMACDDTKFALTTAMSSTNSVPMWFDEYKPGDMKDWELDRFQTLMRKSTRGGVETRGNADKSTEEYRLAAPLMISGEQAVQGAAEERRSIQTRFLDNVKETGSSTREAFAKLTGTAYDAGGVTREPDGYDLQQHAYAYYQFITEQNEEQVREQWKRSRDYVRDLLTTHGITGVDDLPRQGIQTIHFGISMYARFATGVGADELPTRDEIDEALLYVARQFGDKGTRKSHLDRFVELASRAAAEEYIEEGKHYTVVKQGTPEEEIAIKLSRTFDAVSKYARDYALDGEDMLNTATDYRDRIKEASDKSRSYVNAASQYTTGLNRCVRIDAATAAEKLNFEPEAFGAETNIDEPADTDGDGEDPDGSSPPTQPDPTPIAEIDPTKQDRATVVGEIHFEKYDGRNSEDGRPDWTASVTDETGTARLIAWDEDQIPPLYNAQGVIDADEIKVTAASTSEYDDELQLTIEGGTTVEEYEEIGLIWSSADAEEATATDGGEEEDDDTDEEADAPVGGTGETAEYEGVAGKVREHLRLNVEKGEKFTAPSVAGELSGSESPGDVTDALIKLKTEGLLERKEGGLFELL